MTTPPHDHWIIRDPKASDISFIYDSWLKCYRGDSELGKSCHTYVFFDVYKHLIDKILNDPETKVKIACLPNDQDVIIGYLVATGPVLHWCFVKEAFRRLNVAAALYFDVFGYTLEPRICTHKTFLVEDIFNKHKRFEFKSLINWKSIYLDYIERNCHD